MTPGRKEARCQSCSQREGDRDRDRDRDREIAKPKQGVEEAMRSPRTTARGSATVRDGVGRKPEGELLRQ